MEQQIDTLPSAQPDRSPSAILSLRRDQRGFTLIEAIIAMMVATVGLIAMAELMAVTLRMQQLGRNATSAIRLGQDKVDELTTTNFGAAAMTCGGSLTTDAADHFDTPVDGDGNSRGYKRRWLVEAGPDGDLNLRQVTVRVIPDLGDRRVTTPTDLVTIIRGVAGAC